MKLCTLACIFWLVILIGLPLAIGWYLFRLTYIPGSEFILACRARLNEQGPSKYNESSLISNSDDQVLCPGDTFGDLNDTYLKVKNCSLQMFHKEKLIWSSNSDIPYTIHGCAFALQRDGNAVLYPEIFTSGARTAGRYVTYPIWSSQTKFYPSKTELRIRDQQLQILQTFKDGTERLFYAHAENQGFIENMGEPKKIANRFILKKTQDKDKTILRRNEYIGDLDGTHLILQTNCQLQLLKKDIILWSIAPTFRHENTCFLTIDETNQVSLSKITNVDDQEEDFTPQRIVQFGGKYKSSDILENWIMFEDDQPVIIQTLKNGSEITFTSGIGHNQGLKLKKKPRQLAEKTLSVPKGDYDGDYSFFSIERMDYIGNLAGLHLILEQNCSFMLINGKQKLWELRQGPDDSPMMGCSIRFDNYGSIVWQRLYSYGKDILTTNYEDRKFMTGYNLTLRNNQLIVTRQLGDEVLDTYIAGPYTEGALFHIIPRSSVTFGVDEKTFFFAEGFMGNRNKVYTRIEEDCNWVLYNKTQMIWESGTSTKEFGRDCSLIFTRNEGLGFASERSNMIKDDYWSTQNLTIDPEKSLHLKRLMVDNSGLWLIHEYTDGTAKFFKAQEGTNDFVHFTNE